MSPSLLVVLLYLFAAAAIFAAIFLAVYTMLSAPSMEPSYLGVRGLKRQQALQQSPLFGQIEPLIRWLGVRVRPLLSEKQREKLDRQLTLASDFLGLLPEEFVALTLLSAAGGLGASIAYALALGKGLLVVLIGVLLGGLLPYLQLNAAEQERRRRIQNGLPYVIDLLALGLSAGLDFPGCLRQVVDKSSNPSDPLIEELSLILQAMQLGKTRKQALAQFAERAPGESVREFVSAVVQADERGNPLGPVLQIQAEVSRQRRSTRAEEAASKAAVKIMAPMLLLLIALLLLILSPMLIGLGDVLS